MTFRIALLSALAFLLGLPPTRLAAQDESVDALRSRCDIALLPAGPATALCQDVVSGLVLLQPEVGMLVAGGNPVLGTASPIGTRFRFIPRLNIGARITVVFVDVPNVLDFAEGGEPAGELGFALPMPQLDLSLGIFDGVRFSPGVGGLASVEILGSASALILPSDEGFTTDRAAYGLGARLGILRESFLAPGMSVSGMYKWVDRLAFGDVESGDDAQFGSDLRVLSFRAGISKSFLVFGLALGVGWDRYESDVDFALSPTVVEGFSAQPVVIVPEDDPAELESERWSVFVDFSYILLFFNFVGEVGWQQSETVPLSNEDEIDAGNLFGAVGLRISL